MVRGSADAAGLALFRALFGGLMALAVVRFWWMGWIECIYLEPAFHFTYPGFEWATPWPAPWIYLHFTALLMAALALALGLFPRVAAGTFFVLFTYAELWERAAYLNHYYFVSLVALLLTVIPTAGYFSVRPRLDQRRVPQLAYTALRFQLGVVYFYAGFAKLNPDWLIRGEPLHTWLQPHSELFTLGGAIPLLAVAIAMSWAGALFDLTIWFWMRFERARPLAYTIALVFHITVWLLFPIGIFSFVMLTALTIYFAPSWPRRLRRLPEATGDAPRPTPLASFAFALFVALQIAIPARFVVYVSDPNWTTEGFDFAWRVMLVEKVGSVEFDVVTDRGNYSVYPRSELTPQQYHMLTIQPDMMVEYARHLRSRHEARGERVHRVAARARMAFNGRPSQVYIDPDCDLSVLERFDFAHCVEPLKP